MSAEIFFCFLAKFFVFGYSFTAKAQEKLDRLSGAAQAVEPAPVKKPDYQEQDVLKSSREVLPDLRDDDGVQN